METWENILQTITLMLLFDGFGADQQAGARLPDASIGWRS
jgi:hypothetical protein